MLGRVVNDLVEAGELKVTKKGRGRRATVYCKQNGGLFDEGE